MLKWFSKDKETELELPEELKGKTPEQIVQAMKTAEQGRVAAEQALQARNAEVEPQLTEFAQTRARLQEIEARGTPPPENGGGQGELTSVLVDENKAFAERMAPLAQIAFNSAALGARSLALEQLSELSRKEGINHTMLFNKYRKEIDETIKGIPLPNHGHPDTWLNVYNVVLGRHATELVNAVKKADGAFFVESAGGPPPPPEVKSEDSLTDTEKAQAAKFGMTPEKYLENKKGLKYVTA